MPAEGHECEETATQLATDMKRGFTDEPDAYDEKELRRCSSPWPDPPV
jgi:hypothetical protein